MSPYLRTKQMDDGLYYVLENGKPIGRGHFSSKGAYMSKRSIEKYRNRNERRSYNAVAA